MSIASGQIVSQYSSIWTDHWAPDDSKKNTMEVRMTIKYALPP